VRAIGIGFGNVRFVLQTRCDQSLHYFPSLVYRSVRDTTSELLGRRQRTVAIPINEIVVEVGPDDVQEDEEAIGDRHVREIRPR